MPQAMLGRIFTSAAALAVKNTGKGSDNELSLQVMTAGRGLIKICHCQDGSNAVRKVQAEVGASCTMTADRAGVNHEVGISSKHAIGTIKLLPERLL